MEQVNKDNDSTAAILNECELALNNEGNRLEQKEVKNFAACLRVRAEMSKTQIHLARERAASKNLKKLDTNSKTIANRPKGLGTDGQNNGVC